MAVDTTSEHEQRLAAMDHSTSGMPPEPPACSDLPATRRSMPNLDFDVLRAILAYCRAADLLQVSLASHELRDEAMNELVSRPVHLKGEDQLDSFLRFMLPGDGFRFPLLRALTLEDIPLRLSGRWPALIHDKLRDMMSQTTTLEDLAVVVSVMRDPPPDILLGATVLARATGLRDLKFLRCHHGSSSLPPKFVKAVSTLSLLRRFQVIECSDNIADLALSLTSSLETLEYPFDRARPHRDRRWLSRPAYITDAFLNTLAQRQPHLKTLLLTCESITPTTWITPFPHVRVLTLTILDESIDFRHFVYLFPRLIELTIFTYARDLDIIHEVPRLSTVRTSAIAAQAAGYRWPCLNALRGSLGDLYILAVTSPVRRLAVESYEPRMLNILADVIASSRPQCVELEFFFGGPGLWRQGCALAGTERDMLVYGGDDNRPAGAVSHLIMGCHIFFTRSGVCSTSNSSMPSISDILEAATPIVEHSAVEYVHLTLTHYFVRRDWRTIGETDFNTGMDMPLQPAIIQVMSTLDIDVLAYGLAALGSHIRTVVLTILTRGQIVWEVERGNSNSGEGPVLRKLDSYAGGQVVAREESR